MRGKRIAAVLLAAVLFFCGALPQTAVKADTGTELGLTASSVVLMEGSTGEVIYASNENVELPPASITKIMTLLLIFEALDKGSITLKDLVTVSEYAASMGGSQVYLEPFETQTVDDMIKCVSIASANDAAVSMAELIAGSEQEFVTRMNARAKELGMEHTKFVNCTGLDVEGHYSSALDVALMSRELIVKHPEISNYSTVWMDTIVHKTKRGESEFGLTNTNKLVRFYQGITGLKTGSTSKAKFCLSATAHRNDMDLIAVVMACPSPKDRFAEAAKLLDYGFANCSVFKDDNAELTVPPVPLKKGVKSEINGRVADIFSFTCLKGENKADITKEIVMQEELTAPVAEGDIIGEVRYSLGGEAIGKVNIVAAETVEKATYTDYLLKFFRNLLNLEQENSSKAEPQKPSTAEDAESQNTDSQNAAGEGTDAADAAAEETAGNLKPSAE